MTALTGKKIARVATVPIFITAHLKHQVHALKQAGMDVHIVTSNGPQIAEIEWSEHLKHIEIDIARNINPFRDFKALLALIRLFRSNEFDIIHSTTPKAGLLSAIAARLSRAPIRLHTFTGQPWVTRTGAVRWLSRNSDRLIGKLNTHCYADSKSQRQFLMDEGLLSAEDISVIGEGSVAGVDVERFSRNKYSVEALNEVRKELGIGVADKVIVFLGRVCVDKGIFELIEAYKNLQVDIPNVRLLIVGPLETEEKDGLLLSEEFFRSVPGISRLGYTTEPEKIFAIAHCLCLPSFREGFGSVIMEAASMGVPAVASRIYGLTDAIVDHKTGLLVTPGKANELQHALTSILNDDKWRNTLGKNARSRAREMFSSSRMNQLVIEEYQRLIEVNR